MEMNFSMNFTALFAVVLAIVFLVNADDGHEELVESILQRARNSTRLADTAKDIKKEIETNTDKNKTPSSFDNSESHRKHTKRKSKKIIKSGESLNRMIPTQSVARKETMPLESPVKEKQQPGKISWTVPPWSKQNLGKLNVHVWHAWCGNAVTDLKNNIHFPRYPDVHLMVNRFLIKHSESDFGQRVFGFVHPPQTGLYTFAISSDDYAELWLSTDDNPLNIELIANVGSTNNSVVYFQDLPLEGEFDKFNGQISKSIYLEHGKKYFIEALHKQFKTYDHLLVAWKIPGLPDEFRYISGNRISAYIYDKTASDDVTVYSQYIPWNLPSQKSTKSVMKGEFSSYSEATIYNQNSTDFHKIPLMNENDIDGILETCPYAPSYIVDFPLRRYEGVNLVHDTAVYPDDKTKLPYFFDRDFSDQCTKRRIKAYEEKAMINRFFSKRIVDYSSIESNLSKAVRYYNITGQSLLELFFDRDRKKDLLGRYNKDVLEVRNTEQTKSYTLSQGPFKMSMRLKESPHLDTQENENLRVQAKKVGTSLHKGFEIFKNQRKLLQLKETMPMSSKVEKGRQTSIEQNQNIEPQVNRRSEEEENKTRRQTESPDARRERALRERIINLGKRYGVSLTEKDLQTIYQKIFVEANKPKQQQPVQTRSDNSGLSSGRFKISPWIYHQGRVDCTSDGNRRLSKDIARSVVTRYMKKIRAKYGSKYKLRKIVNIEENHDVVKGDRYLVELNLDVEGQNHPVRLSEFVYQKIGSAKLCSPQGLHWGKHNTVHIIIPVKNQGKWVQHFIDNMAKIYESTLDPHFNIIIVDFESSDIDIEGALERSSLKRYEVVKLTGPFQRAYGLQAGAQAVTNPSDIIFMCDLHLQIPVNLIESIQKHCVEGKMAFAPILVRLQCGFTPSDPYGNWELQGYGLFAIYKSDFDQIGGMNTEEFQTTWGGEDWEFLDRVLSAGLEVERLRVPFFYHHYHSKRGLWGNNQFSNVTFQFDSEEEDIPVAEPVSIETPTLSTIRILEQYDENGEIPTYES